MVQKRIKIRELEYKNRHIDFEKGRIEAIERFNTKKLEAYQIAIKIKV